jgi:hypothetical protein
MRHLCLGVIFATIAAIVPIAAFPDSDILSAGYMMTLSVPKTQYRVDEKIVVSVTFLNVGGSALDVLDDCSLGTQVLFLITAADGKPTLLQERAADACKFGGPLNHQPAGPNTIPPGAQHSFEFDLSADYKLPTAPGVYGLQALYEMNHAIAKRSKIVSITLTQ